jgi:hypothetical protein
MYNGRLVELLGFFKRHIEHTEKDSLVVEETLAVCNLSRKVVTFLDALSPKVYITTRALKHLYDKRPAQEFDFILHNMHVIIKFPDDIFRNKTGKRGDCCFVKEFKGVKYFLSLQKIEPLDPLEDTERYYVATCFRTDDAYLKKYEKIWCWKGDIPSS